MWEPLLFLRDLIIALLLLINPHAPLPDIPCWTWNQSLGDRLGIQDDSQVMPPCPVQR